jgi:hypothetical protein
VGVVVIDPDLSGFSDFHNGPPFVMGFNICADSELSYDIQIIHAI